MLETAAELVTRLSAHLVLCVSAVYSISATLKQLNETNHRGDAENAEDAQRVASRTRRCKRFERSLLKKEQEVVGLFHREEFLIAVRLNNERAYRSRNWPSLFLLCKSVDYF